MFAFSDNGAAIACYALFHPLDTSGINRHVFTSTYACLVTLNNHPVGISRHTPNTSRGKWGKADYLRNSMQYFFTECDYLTKDFSIG